LRKQFAQRIEALGSRPLNGRHFGATRSPIRRRHSQPALGMGRSLGRNDRSFDLMRPRFTRRQFGRRGGDGRRGGLLPGRRGFPLLDARRRDRSWGLPLGVGLERGPLWLNADGLYKDDRSCGWPLHRPGGRRGVTIRWDVRSKRCCGYFQRKCRYARGRGSARLKRQGRADRKQCGRRGSEKKDTHERHSKVRTCGLTTSSELGGTKAQRWEPGGTPPRAFRVTERWRELS
jgi:hypothetical protein